MAQKRVNMKEVKICEEMYTYIGDVQGRKGNYNNEEKENVISEA